MDMVKDQLF